MPWTFYSATGQKLTSTVTNISNLDIDGGTAIGEAVVGADLFIMDNGAGGTNVKVTATEVATFIGAPAQAVQSDIEAQTNQNTYIPPDLLKHNPGVGKFWVNVPANGVVSISAANSTNVASVDDDGTGARGVNLTVAFASTTFAALASGDTLHAAATIINSSDVLVGVYNTSHAAADSVTQAGGFGDQ